MSAGAHCSPLGKMAKITDFLYLGGLAAAKTEDLLKEKGITCVINASMEAPDLNYESIKCTRIRLEDNPTCNIGIHFDLVADKIDKVRRERGKVLVHCIAGVSRSATLVLAYLMKYQKMRLIDAHAYVKARRPLIRPNSGFWKDLVDFEKKLFHKNTINMVESKFEVIHGKINLKFSTSKEIHSFRTSLKWMSTRPCRHPVEPPSESHDN